MILKKEERFKEMIWKFCKIVDKNKWIIIIFKSYIKWIQILRVMITMKY